jgi:hypothetical protein
LVLREPLASVVHSCLTRAAVGDLWECCASAGVWEVLTLEPQTLEPRDLAIKYDFPSGERGALSLGVQ